MVPQKKKQRFFTNQMPRKNRKCKKKINQLECGEAAAVTPQTKGATISEQLQVKEIEQVVAVLKSSDLVGKRSKLSEKKNVLRFRMMFH